MFGNSGNSLQKDSPVVFNLIIISAIIFAVQSFLNPQFQQFIGKPIEEWGAIFYFKSQMFKPHQMFTCIFLHASIGHLFFNMMGLYFFGPTLEKIWGSKRFLFFYIFCGVLASICYSVSLPFFTKGNTELLMFSSAIGASGAIMGVLIANAYLFPNTEIYMMFIPIPLKLKYAAPIWIAIDIFGAFGKGSSNIAHSAHLGGAIAGFLLVLYWNKTNKKTFY